MRLSEIWTYPVKSMIGFTTPSALLGETGIVGDRRWALRDAASGGLRTGKKVSALMQCAATTDGPDSPAARIVLPDGTEHTEELYFTSATDAETVEAAWIGAAVVSLACLVEVRTAGVLLSARLVCGCRGKRRLGATPTDNR